MFEKLVELLRSQASLTKNIAGEPTQRDLQVATGILLLEMAGADQDYAPEETQTIFAVMETEFALEKTAAFEILNTADEVRQQRKVDEVVQIINDRFSDAQRERVYAMLWRVMLADGRIDRFESRYAAQLRNRLRLSVEQHERAKKAAEMNKI